MDAVWLRIHPFGTGNSGPLVLKRYLRACRDLHTLNVPLVGELRQLPATLRTGNPPYSIRSYWSR
jgi:hypothetical protein